MDDFDSFVLGGSKSGALNPEQLDALTGKTFYNYWNNGGNFYDYEQILDFILRKKKNAVKQIVLHLSVHEAQEYNRNSFMPSAMYNNPFERIFYKAKIIMQFYLNVSTFTDFRRTFEKELWIPHEQSRNGTDRAETDPISQELFKNNPAMFRRLVLSYWTEYDMAIENLFRMEQRLPACDDNIAALRRIKAKCDERGITLTVVLAPTFVSELYMYKSPQFWDYFRAIAEVQPFWNFSGINAVSMNPYNFLNGGHYFYFIGDRMANIMFGTDDRAGESAAAADFGGMDDFGQLITPENVDEYIARQTELWLALKDEYERTGTVTLMEE